MSNLRLPSRRQLTTPGLVLNFPLVFTLVSVVHDGGFS